MLPYVQKIYDEYPRKVGPDHAFRAINDALRQGIKFDELLEKTRLYAQARRRPGQDMKLTPHPAAWFRRGSWKEDPEQWLALDFEPRGPALFDGLNEFMASVEGGGT
jgi:hypothetical protein